MAVIASARQGRVRDRPQGRLRDPTHTCPEDLLVFDEHVIAHLGLTDWSPYYVVRAPHLERYAQVNKLLHLGTSFCIYSRASFSLSDTSNLNWRSGSGSTKDAAKRRSSRSAETNRAAVLSSVPYNAMSMKA